MNFRSIDQFRDLLAAVRVFEAAECRYLRVFPPYVDCVTPWIHDERQDARKDLATAERELRSRGVEVPEGYVDAVRLCTRSDSCT